LALIEGCRHSIEISVPVDAVNAETEKVAGDFQKRARIPGFRPGKAPLSMIRKSFESDIRQKVVENLIPRYLDQQFEQDQLKVVSRPEVIDVHYTPGEPIVFKAEFEVAPEFEIGEYRGIEAPYREPQVTDEQISHQLEHMRESRATYANVDPRPLEDGDFAVISLESKSGAEEPIKSDELTLEVGGKETLEGFSNGLRGMSPGEEEDIEVTYPEGYGQEKLAGKTVTFRVQVKGVRKKELPELNDEFAQDMGDFRTLDELRETVRKQIYAQADRAAQSYTRGKIIDALVDAHQFPVPQAYVDRQIQNRVQDRLRSLAAEGVDVGQFNPDWTKMREAMGEQARREVIASLLLGRISERESIHATQEEVDREVENIARQQRQPLPAVRKRLEESGAMGNIVSQITTEKVLRFLFENSRKVEPTEPIPTESEETEEAPAEQA
jgi:trigger factor